MRAHDTSPTRTAHLGWSSHRRRSQANSRKAPQRAAPLAASPRRGVPRPHHAAGRLRNPLPSRPARVSSGPRCAERGLACEVSNRGVLHAGGPHPSDRRGGRHTRVGARRPRSRHSPRTRREPHTGTSRPGLGRSLSHARAHDPAGGTPCAGLRVDEFPEARTRYVAGRSLLLGAVLRRMAWPDGEHDDSQTHTSRAHMAREHWLATARAHRHQRATARKPLAVTPSAVTPPA